VPPFFAPHKHISFLFPESPGLQYLELYPRGSVMQSGISRRWTVSLVLAVATAISYAQWTNPADDIPAYHSDAPLKVSSLPPILSGARLSGENFRYPWQVHVYQQAAKVSSVLYQLPCNCRCDRALGHTSLRSCFEGLHGTECSTCAKEGLFAYQQTKAGKTPAQIRASIGRHEYESMPLESQ
jgi:hypothetical protein